VSVKKAVRHLKGTGRIPGKVITGTLENSVMFDFAPALSDFAQIARWPIKPVKIA
jgi:hypothetical protein